MKNGKPVTQDQKNEVLIDQTSACLLNASKHAKVKDFARTENALLGALNDIKAIKEFHDPDALSAFKQKVRTIDNEVRESRSHPEDFEDRLIKLSEEALTLKAPVLIPAEM